MLDLPNGFADENDRRHMSNQTPSLFHRQPESPGSRNAHAGGELFYPPDQSFNSAYDHDLNFSLLVSGTQPFETGHHFMHPGTSGIDYVSHTPGSDLLSMPSGTPDHAFPSHYSSIYESDLTINSPHYSTGLSHLQGINNALSAHSRHSVLHAPSPCESDSSFEEPGSGYSSPSMTPHQNSTMTLPSHSETEEYLRHTLEIPPHLPVNLSALPDATERKQPPITHMIKLAIWGSKDKMLTLRGIYNEIEKRYPSLKDLQDKPWQRSIRHNLSLKAIFVRLERPPNVPGSGHYWAVNIRNGEGNKRDRKRKDASSRGSSSKSRSDEEDEFSEDVDEDRATAGSRQRHGEHRALRIPSQIPSQYSATPPGFPSAPMETSRMSYQHVMPSSRIDRSSPQPHPAQTGTSSSGRSNEFYPYPRGMPLPPNIENRPFYRTIYGNIMDLPDQMPFGPYMQEQMSMANMATSMTDHQMPALGPSPYAQGSGSRRPSPDEDQDNDRKNRRRTID